MVHADSLRIEQVLGNLLGNALKFTERGTITLEVKAVENADAGDYRISFAVSDSGIGIREDQLPRLFKPFSQVDGSLSRRHGGSGLGLVIVRRLCELMGGTVEARSEFGRGSVFTASLVARSVVAMEEVSLPKAGGVAAVETGRSLRMLVAEDNALNRKLMRRMIERLGYDSQFASDGLEAVQLAATTAYDVIFMDVSMPGVNGLDATRAIRSHERKAGRLASRIVALTAGVSESEREACAEAGMDDFLGKPFTEEGLRAALKGAEEYRAVGPSPGG
jgi:CheY-like chemotaxis protein